MATETAVEIGTFCQPLASLIVPPTEAELRAILRPPSGDVRPILESLITLKLLAPEESADLLIHPNSQVADLIAQIATNILQSHLTEVERGHR